MNVVIYPSKVKGTIQIPASKSISQRVLALALLHSGKTTIINPGKSEDELAILSVIRQLGCNIIYSDSAIQITGIDKINFSGTFDCGESGLALRMFTFICALSAHESTLTGSGTLAKRDMRSFDKILPGLGVKITSNNGRIPITVKGPLIPSDVTVDGSESSQYISGLMMALAYSSVRHITIILSDAVSIPYIDLTVKTMQEFGYPVERHSNKIFVLPATKTRDDIIQTIEGDWSNAAFWLVAATLNGKLYLKGLNFNSLQGDRSVIDIMGQCGITSKSENGFLIVEKPHFLYSFHCDATNTPDLFPPLVALACYCNGISTIKGVHRLVNKESNRATGLVEVFSKLGIHIWIEQDTMMIEGSAISGGTINAQGDHRIAMAASIAALRAKSTVTVLGANAVMKSYPDFYDHLKNIGTKFTLTED